MSFMARGLSMRVHCRRWNAHSANPLCHRLCAASFYAASFHAIQAQPQGEMRRQPVVCLRHGLSTRVPAIRTATGSAADARTPTASFASACSKGTDRRVVSQEELDGTANSLNSGPCTTHDRHTPTGGLRADLHQLS